mmetsp:Transcript_3234/g.7697  ORF Transcript_3234/g.7697 Transcript_3234/m.7697 type:complete len:94 (+) Transcript_3234:462-743(+)
MRSQFSRYGAAGANAVQEAVEAARGGGLDVSIATASALAWNAHSRTSSFDQCYFTSSFDQCYFYGARAPFYWSLRRMPLYGQLDGQSEYCCHV